MREAAAPGSPCPLPAEEGGASGPGAACTMPTSFTVVPVEAQGEGRQRDGQQREEEEEDEGDERERGAGERAGERRGSTRADRLGSVRAGERVCRMGRAGGPPESPRTLRRGRIASLQPAMPGLPVQVEKRASGKGESLAPGVAESLFLFVSISQRRRPKGGSSPGRLQPGERSSPRSGAAPARGGAGRSVRLPPAPAAAPPTALLRPGKHLQSVV